MLLIVDRVGGAKSAALSAGTAGVRKDCSSASGNALASLLMAVTTAAPSNMMRCSSASKCSKEPARRGWLGLPAAVSAAALPPERLPLRAAFSPTATKDWVSSFHKVWKTWFMRWFPSQGWPVWP